MFCDKAEVVYFGVLETSDRLTLNRKKMVVFQRKATDFKTVLESNVWELLICSSRIILNSVWFLLYVQVPTQEER